MAWTSPRTWVSGEVLTAALLNTHVRDNLLELNSTTSTWTAYSPVWSTTAPATPTFSTQTGRYKQVGKTVVCQFYIVASSAAASGTWEITLPVTARELTAAHTPMGLVALYTSSSQMNFAHSKSGDLTKIQLQQQGQSGGITGRVVAAISSGNALWGNLTYEAA